MSADGKAMGFFTDTTLCIGCKACEVACKQWNQLDDDGFVFGGFGYDNTGHLGASTWRHVAFVERDRPLGRQQTGVGDFSWLFSSDVCKHCRQAGCLESCPTGAIVRTELDSVFVQSDVCNGCGYCVVSCPFGVVARGEESGVAGKCTLCYDRQKDGLTPACAKSCPTASIVFGPVDELRRRAHERVAELQARGVGEARLYGADAETQPGTGGLNAFFLLVDRPEVYNLPPAPEAPARSQGDGWRAVGWGALAMAAMALFASTGARRRR